MSIVPAKKNIYRIRGLTQSARQELPPQPISDNVVTLAEIPTAKHSNLSYMAYAVKAIGAPKLTDFLPGAPTDRLSSWWATSRFFTGKSTSIKDQPRALGPYLPDSKSCQGMGDFRIIDECWRPQDQAIKEVIQILDLADAQKLTSSSARLVSTPLAAALLGVLLRGLKGDHQGNAGLADLIQQSPIAVFLLVQWGSPHQRADFIEHVVADPYLTFALCLEKRFFSLLSEETLVTSFAKLPHLLPLARFARDTLDEYDAWCDLLKIAETNRMAAAFALGINPDNERATHWHELVMTSPEAAYWTLRVWIAHSPRATLIPRWSEYQCLVKRDQHWLYHWLRDIDLTEAKDAVRWHWPSPWAVEMVTDLQLEPEFVQKLIHAFENSDDDDPWASTFLLWASDYCTKNQNPENEPTDNS